MCHSCRVVELKGAESSNYIPEEVIQSVKSKAKSKYRIVHGN